MIRRLFWLASTPFNVTALIVLFSLGMLRLVQARPIALGVDPAIIEFQQGPRKNEISLRLYFSGVDGKSFAIETRRIPVTSNTLADRSNAAVSAWISGPTSQGALSLVTISGLPDPIVFAKSGVIFVDFSAVWAQNQLGSAGEFLMICGLANSLLELDGAKSVQYLLGGKIVETIGGHVETTDVLTTKICRGS